MGDKEKFKKLRRRIRQLEHLRAQPHDTLPALPGIEDLPRKVFDSANDGIIIHDTLGKIYEVNQTMYQRLGYTKAEMLQMTLQDLVAPGFGPLIQERTSRLERDGVAIFESADVRKDGTVLPVEVSARIIEHNGLKLIQSIVRDIQERKIAEELIQNAREEREVLLEEIQHQVRMHHDLCIAGLEILKQQGEEHRLPERLEDQIRRIRALHYIQSRIYGYGNVTQINFAQIAAGLSKHLLTLYAEDASRIRYDMAIDGIFLDIRRTSACAQLLIELVGNALRHAFPGKNGGTIEIRMSRSEDALHTLTIADDGIGFPDGLDPQGNHTLGMRLIEDLVRQLQGFLSREHGRGSRFIIRFP